jgi:deoxyribodipyrimidine photo-lyase
MTAGVDQARGRTAIVLFTRDLRVHDHRGLSEAARTAAQVVPLFVLDDAVLRHAGAPNRLAFLLAALADLRRSLRRLGTDLILRRGDPVAEAMRVARAARADSVYVSGDVSAYAQRREQRLARACRCERLSLRIENTTAAVPAGDLVPAERDHYRVFTPYWRRWQSVGLPAIGGPPEQLILPAGLEDRGRLPALEELSPRKPSPDLPRGGEGEARRRLDRWLADGLGRYEQARDDLAVEGTSRLSPYLHFGCLSAVEVVTQARERGPIADAFVRQLCWRDFYAQLLAANRCTPARDLHPLGDEWNIDEEALVRWRDGQTGYPIVDAAMRQLRHEGWLHNRARLIAGSFLTKTLYLDWRLGAQVFFDLLVDADVGNNVGNWQWVAGTGVDTRRNRLFNPITQARRFDPDGAYVRRYVPELAELSGPAVHEPWQAPLARVAPDYPAPIVDHVQAAARFRANRQALRHDAALVRD